jgi:hypothetical protein
MEIEFCDQVSITGESGVWKVVGSRTTEPCWEVQLGMDGASKRWVRTDALTIVARAVSLATWLGPLRRFVLAHPLGR